MKRLGLILAVALAASAANAADLPTKGPSYAPAPMISWTGLYAGVNAGYGWGRADAGGIGSDINGAIGGGQIGYNWQMGSLVLGAELDLQASGQRSSSTLGIFTVENRMPWFGTARARIGYAAGPWLIYATGGAAWGNYKLSVSALGTTVSDNSTKSAWTAGGGVEYMLTQNWSAKLEYLYIDTGNTNVTLFGTTFNGRLTDNIVRVGANYHF